ncbi:MAG: type II toxin-antitoxin system VapC family toxin [Ectothiorhodospiraceae bacterium]|nr:type II toxin-antitoxin system VapC family toxin [Ectothiorhodospiraceae bacterium]
MRRLLLDTHVFLWWLADDPQLGGEARAVIAEYENTVYVSADMGWEISIKKALGKLETPDGLDALVDSEGFEHLPVTFFHGEQVGMLPRHHKDPFDRMLIAQAQAAVRVVVTAKYDGLAEWDKACKS